MHVAHPNIDFTMVHVGDGNLDNMQPDEGRDEWICAALAPGGHKLQAAGSAAELGAVKDLSKRSKEFVAQIEEAHWRTCAEAVHRSLCEAAPVMDAQIAAALGVCSRATAVMPLRELAAAVASRGDVAETWEYLEISLMGTLRRCNFACVGHGVAWDSASSLSWPLSAPPTRIIHVRHSRRTDDNTTQRRQNAQLEDVA